MKRVLIVAYYYPPSAEVGVFRTLKFTKYLPEFGFAPFILTVRNRSLGALDRSLLAEVPPETTVVETFSAEHRFLRAPRLLGVDPKWLLIPDTHIGWLPFAVRSGETIIRRRRIDVIFATAPPFTSLLVGYLLKKRTGVPLVLDFRDPWIQNAFNAFPAALHRRIEERMERSVVQSADYVITTTGEMRRALIERYPFLQNRCVTIPNGFDSADFRGLSRKASLDRFTITYSGKLYGLRSAEHFFTALAGLLEKNDDLRTKIRVVFAGPKDKRTLTLVRELRLEDVVDMVGFVAHRESLQLMVNADVLLLIMSRKEAGSNGRGTMMIPGKTFEYLGARRPIFALAPDGEVSDLIRETGSGLVLPPDDANAIERGLLELLDRWRARTLTVEPHDISLFDRKKLTSKLAAIFELLCNESVDEPS